MFIKRQLPLPGFYIVTDNIQVPVVTDNFKITAGRRQPSVNYFQRPDFTFTQPEAAGRFFPSVSCTAFYPNIHRYFSLIFSKCRHQPRALFFTLMQCQRRKRANRKQPNSNPAQSAIPLLIPKSKTAPIRSNSIPLSKNPTAIPRPYVTELLTAWPKVLFSRGLNRSMYRMLAT